MNRRILPRRKLNDTEARIIRAERRADPAGRPAAPTCARPTRYRSRYSSHWSPRRHLHHPSQRLRHRGPLLPDHIPPAADPSSSSRLRGDFSITGVAHGGETINIPANAPPQFHNSSSRPIRMMCICSPAGQEEFFQEVGVAVATRTTPPPKLDEATQAQLKTKAALAPKYRTEFLEHAKGPSADKLRTGEDLTYRWQRQPA